MLRLPERLTAFLTVALLAACGGGNGGGCEPTDPSCNGGEPPATAPSIAWDQANLDTEEDGQAVNEDFATLVQDGDIDSLTIENGADIINLEFQNGEGTITPQPEENGQYALRAWLSNQDTSTTSTSPNFNVAPRTDIEGTVINHLTEPDSGAIKIYETQDATQQITKINTDSQGHITRTQIKNQTQYLIRIRAFGGADPTSFVRNTTIQIQQGQDIRLGEITVESYQGLQQNGWKPQEFQWYLCDPNDHDNDGKFGVMSMAGTQQCVTLKENWGTVYIARNAPFEKDGQLVGEFTNNDQEFLKEQFTNSSDIPTMLGDEIPTVVLGRDENNDGKDDDPPYQVVADTLQIEPATVVIYHDSTINRAGLTRIKGVNQDGEFNTARVRLKTTPQQGKEAMDWLMSHEGGRLAGLEGLASDDVPPSQTIMRISNPFGTPLVPQYADIRAANTNRRYQPLTPVLDIYGLEF